ncbi:unknown [Clostridium sp. CAG:169]|nr:unknown [Clostridium sp. CAG:169]
MPSHIKIATGTPLTSICRSSRSVEFWLSARTLTIFSIKSRFKRTLACLRLPVPCGWEASRNPPCRSSFGSCCGCISRLKNDVINR